MHKDYVDRQFKDIKNTILLTDSYYFTLSERARIESKIDELCKEIDDLYDSKCKTNAI